MPVSTIALVLTLGSLSTTGQTPEPAGSPRAIADETSHDFGTHERGETLTHSFTIRNEGDAPLALLRVDLSQPAMRSRFKGSVPVGEEGRVLVEWDTSRFSGDLDAQVVVHTNDPTRQRLTFTLTGTITRTIDIQPSPDIFLSLFRDETAVRRLTIVNNETRSLAITNTRTEGEHFAADINVVEAGKRYELVVTVPSGQQAGRYMGAVYLETDHPRARQLRVGVNVFIKDDLYASPEAIDFGDVDLRLVRRTRLAPAVTNTSTIRSRHDAFAITGVSSDLQALRIDRSPAGRAPAFQLEVSLDPDHVEMGAIDGSIRIETDHPRFPILLIPVRGNVR